MTPQQLSKVHALFRSRQNVVVSNLLRQNGYSYRVAFGCTLPDLKEIAELLRQGAVEDVDLEDVEAQKNFCIALREDCGIRESMMLAPMFCPRGSVTDDEAEQWVELIPTREVADVVCMYALQFQVGHQLVEKWKASEHPMRRYCAQQLAKRLEIAI